MGEVEEETARPGEESLIPRPPISFIYLFILTGG